MKVNKVIKETHSMQQQVKELNEKIEEHKKYIQKYFDEQESLDNSINAGNVKATKVTSAYIKYNGYSLERSLKKKEKTKIVDQVIKKKYEVVDIKAFTDLIKLTAITPHELKKHLHIIRTVDGDAVKRLFEKGDITKEDLDGCFESNIVNSIRLTEIKTPEGD